MYKNTYIFKRHLAYKNKFVLNHPDEVLIEMSI